MKKMLYFAMALLASANLWAQEPTAITQIKLQSESGGNLTTTLIEGAGFASAFDETSISLYPNTVNTSNVNVYTLHETATYSEYHTQTIANVPMGMITDRNVAAKQHYTLSFTVALGRTMKLYDAVLDSMINMENSTSYAFEVTTANCPSYVSGTNTTINDRFIIEPQYIPSTDSLAVCHENGELIINSNPYTTNIVVKDAENNVVIDKNPWTTPQHISLESLDAGRYTVEFNNGKKKYIIAVKRR